MKLFNRLIRILEIIFYLISFQINVINCQQYVPKKRAFNTVTLVGKKIFFLGGFTESPKSSFINDFFTLDVSNSFNQSEEFPFEDLSKLSTNVLIPGHNRATTSVANDTFFLFGGHMGNYSDYASKILLMATSSCGAKEIKHKPIKYYNVMDTFDTINKVWLSINFDGTASAPTKDVSRN
ncbi:hypothetical protein RhiirA1_474210 [Rhizophagus irregularis]|uniref:Galactose oxidase n=1 Tax=Rhizophagus irregularis TaxID=588596 RepID=A0A2N0QZ10_9GLOM|nr:hypothetical protein RhiirA1_474210 [Rhizophagus irregularis]CAB4483523.1 unnamed protein product [Rhizophagus irregularis]